MPPPLPLEIRTREIQLRNGCRTRGLAKTGVPQSLAIAILPQIQALRSSNSLTVDDSLSTRVRLNYSHTILRLGYPATSLLLMGDCDATIGHSAALPRNKLERANDRIRCNALATVPILKVQFMRALQSRIVQQWRATRRSRRFDRTVPPNAKPHRHAARSVICSSNQRVYRRREFSHNNFDMCSFGESRILSRGTSNERTQKSPAQGEYRQPAARIYAPDSILDKTLKHLLDN
jgi:hypothetical protein